jgi:hypothetical protein
MREEFIKEIQKMDFSPRFINEAAQSHGNGVNVWRSCVNALLRPSEEDKKKIGSIRSFSYTWRYYDILDKKYKKKFKRFAGTEPIYTAPTFEIYRQCQDGKSAFIVVVNNQIYSSFEYEDLKPLINKAQINADGHICEMLFLAFPSRKETIIIMGINNEPAPAFFWGVPFLISSAEADEVTLDCGQRTRISIERIKDDRPIFVFSF